jgi:hypothetical protein
MKTQLRITQQQLDDMRLDLRRPHPFALERVGFLYCRYGQLGKNGLAVLAYEYVPVADEHYIDDPDFGAVIGSGAFREVLQHTFDIPVGVFHVHLHDHRGAPGPSRQDLSETAKFVPDFFHGRVDLPHGALILSADGISGRIWFGEHKKPEAIHEVRIIGAPLTSFGGRV